MKKQTRIHNNKKKKKKNTAIITFIQYKEIQVYIDREFYDSC